MLALHMEVVNEWLLDGCTLGCASPWEDMMRHFWWSVVSTRHSTPGASGFDSLAMVAVTLGAKMRVR